MSGSTWRGWGVRGGRSLIRTLFLVAAGGMSSCGDKKQPSTQGDQEESIPPGQWSLVLDSPTVTLGGSEDPDYDFEGGLNVILLSDGRLVVIDGSPWPVRAYSARGKLLKKFRAGEGPEEFPRLGTGGFVTSADTVVLGNVGRGPLRLLEPESLNIVRSVATVGIEGGNIVVSDKLGDGSWMGFREFRDPPPNSDQPFVMEQEWIWMSADLTVLRVLDRFPVVQIIPERLRDGAMRYDPPELSRFTTVSFHDGMMYRSFNRLPDIEVWDSSKSLVRRLHIDLPPAVVTPPMRQAWIDNAVAHYRKHYGPNSPFERSARNARFADSTNYFFRIVHGTDGSTWVWKFDPVPDSITEHFVFSKQGRHIGTLTMPANMVLHGTDGKVAAITMMDEDDNILVKVVPIRRLR